MQHRDKVILEKIQSEISIALDIMHGADYAAFNADEVLKRAVCMTVINIGELVKNLSFETRNEYSAIPWKDIAGFRDIAAHKYQTLNMGDVYHTVINDFPALMEQIQRILSD